MTKIIKELEENEVFVFGSNLAGRHGKGAAKDALKWGAQYGKGTGRQGRTYAIPTKDENLKVLPLEIIHSYVHKFLIYAALRPSTNFLVTRIGCGLAGYKDEEIQPFFKKVPNNVILPELWKVNT